MLIVFQRHCLACRCAPVDCSRAWCSWAELDRWAFAFCRYAWFTSPRKTEQSLCSVFVSSATITLPPVKEVIHFFNPFSYHFCSSWRNDWITLKPGQSCASTGSLLKAKQQAAFRLMSWLSFDLLYWLCVQSPPPSFFFKSSVSVMWLSCCRGYNLSDSEEQPHVWLCCSSG